MLSHGLLWVRLVVGDELEDSSPGPQAGLGVVCGGDPCLCLPAAHPSPSVSGPRHKRDQSMLEQECICQWEDSSGSWRARIWP